MCIGNKVGRILRAREDVINRCRISWKPEGSIPSIGLCDFVEFDKVPDQPMEMSITQFSVLCTNGISASLFCFTYPSVVIKSWSGFDLTNGLNRSPYVVRGTAPASDWPAPTKRRALWSFILLPQIHDHQICQSDCRENRQSNNEISSQYTKRNTLCTLSSDHPILLIPIQTTTPIPAPHKLNPSRPPLHWPCPALPCPLPPTRSRNHNHVLSVVPLVHSARPDDRCTASLELRSQNRRCR